MSNDKKQTAVEWYVERLYDLEMANNQGLIMTNTYIKGKREAVEQAKEMEKEQLTDAYWNGGQDVPLHINTCEEWYNKTYGGNK